MIAALASVFVTYGLFGDYINSMISYISRDFSSFFFFLPSPIISFGLQVTVLLMLYSIIRAFVNLLG